MRQHDPFGPAAGSRGVEEHGRVRRIGRHARQRARDRAMPRNPRRKQNAAGRPGTAAGAARSHSTSLAPQSRRMNSTVAAGSFQLTGTATRPARMMPRKAARNSPRLADRMATRSPRFRPCAGGRAPSHRRARRFRGSCRSAAPTRAPRSITAGASGSPLRSIASPRFRSWSARSHLRSAIAHSENAMAVLNAAPAGTTSRCGSTRKPGTERRHCSAVSAATGP